MIAAEDEDRGRWPRQKAHLCAYSLEDRKETVLGDVNSYQITFDGKKMLVKIKKDYAIIDLPKDKLETKRSREDYKLKLEGLDMQLDRHAEWNQIYFECLAAHARLLLFAHHERRRLESDARQIRRAPSIRKSSQRSHLLAGRADW